MRRYSTLPEAIALANDSPYGLQAGLFTNDLRTIKLAFEQIEVGGLPIPVHRYRRLGQSSTAALRRDAILGDV